MSGFSEFWSKLRNKRYRDAFLSAQVKQAIPYQIRTLLQVQNLTQAQFARRAGLTQGAVSRAADPEYGNMSLNTLVRIAAGFDVAFVGRFVPYSELWRWLDHLHDETATIPTFEDEDRHVQLLEREVDVLTAELEPSEEQQPSEHMALSVAEAQQERSLEQMSKLYELAKPQPLKIEVLQQTERKAYGG